MDRLRQRADFLAVADGARASTTAFVLQSRGRDDLGPTRVGFTVTKKNGTATERNRIRRRLREVVRVLGDVAMRPHHDYVLVGRRPALTRDFAALLDDLRTALRRLDRQPAGATRKAGTVRQPDLPPTGFANRTERRDPEQ
jgi:ribonuclease P protein component